MPGYSQQLSYSSGVFTVPNHP